MPEIRIMYKPILSVDLEITNHCNARCFMCPRETLKDLGFMPFESFGTAIRRLKDYGKIKVVSFSGLGESLLHKNIVDFVRYASKNKFNTVLVTNGSLLNKETTASLIQAGIKMINISFSSNNPQTYAKIHCGLEFEKVKKNIEDAILLAKKRGVLVNLQISPTKFSESELRGLIEYWYRKGITFCFVIYDQNNRGGNLAFEYSFRPEGSDEKAHPDAIDLGEVFRPTRAYHRYLMKNVKLPCVVKQDMLFIGWKGDYLLCCMDAKREYILGNVREDSVEQIVGLKEKMELKDLLICQKCSVRERSISMKPRGLFFNLQFAKVKLKNFFRKLTAWD